jgi:hypothetical protein
MEIGGVDIIIPVPPNVPVVGLVLERLRRLWPESIFNDAEGEEHHGISDPWVGLHGEDSREFLVYRDKDALATWERHGADPDHPNSLLHFIVDEAAGVEDGSQELTIVCDERSPEIERFIADLELRFRNPQAR